MTNVVIPRHPPTQDQPVLLAQEGDHAIYWLGVREETAFRSNSYLIQDGEEAILVDPGNRNAFVTIQAQIAPVFNPQGLSGLILGHQDPDVASSAVDWLGRQPELTILSSPRTRVLLPHYGLRDYRFWDIEAQPVYSFSSGRTLRFETAPFLHSPMAFVTYDPTCQLLMTGDIFAAIDTEWQLVVEDFDKHLTKLDLFHIDYMASSVAARGFVRKVRDFPVRMILPQHGSLIPSRFVQEAWDYLETIQCGTDILYPDLF